MTKKLSMIVVISAIILSLLTSCAKEDPIPKVDHKLQPGATSGGVISYGLYGMDGEIEEDYHFQIDSGSKFEKILAFDNLIDVSREYRLIIFANYGQICFSANTEESAYYYDFSAEPYELTQHTISFPQLEDGFYDLLFVIIKDPNNINLDEDYRKRTDMSHMLSMRYSLQVGTSNEIKDELPVTDCDFVKDSILGGVFLNDKKDELQRLLTLDCNNNTRPELFVHIGNQSGETKDYVVFILYDWMQVPIESQMALRVSIPKECRSVIAYIPETFGEIGVHNMTAICVEAPYQIATSASRRADFSIRVGVNNT